ncbi:MAG: cytochrome c [Deltaproteobacteria bacterium]|nr:cytochrome c [Deltaproteobacteria bacterium]
MEQMRKLFLPAVKSAVFVAAFAVLSAAVWLGAAGSDARTNYLHLCSSCHGLTGKGDGVNSTLDMSINPRDHTDANFMSTRSDEQFEDVIHGGGTKAAKSPLMPAWDKTLTAGEIKALVKYLRELCKCQYDGLVSHQKLRKVDLKFGQ